MKHSILIAAAFSVMATTPVIADPTLGFGLSFSFGAGKAETGVGLRVFSDNKQDTVVGSVGVDYMFQSQRWRPTVGAAYLGDDLYFGGDLGYNFSTGGVDFGFSGGATKTEGNSAPVNNTPQVGAI